MTTPTATQQHFFENYPMAIPSAGVLFFDNPDHERVLIVKPSGRALWEIPGGVTEARRGLGDGAPAGCPRRRTEGITPAGNRADTVVQASDQGFGYWREVAFADSGVRRH
ncbi:hypothetical protein [Amycolatopsis vastitatis]|uniref:Nudix hydrolase domain-containing protein n=1 Tax=Amycolatopsis vastitatis TaxID=1905142 RepID=A0A229SPH8_9PSEU|nr:hypothetical protein [Amycolatopsis vastitatis]OXM60955.1 hypothetical protein CF165_39855 [Amycolatopsis vastitatis]